MHTHFCINMLQDTQKVAIHSNIATLQPRNEHRQKWTHTHSLLIDTECYIADNSLHFICMKHWGDAPLPCSSPQEDDWQYVHSRHWNVILLPRIKKKKKSTGSVSSKHYRSPVNFAFCIQDHVLIDISECDLYLMLIRSTHSEKVHACKLKSLETITFRAYEQLIKALLHSSKVL